MQNSGPQVRSRERTLKTARVIDGLVCLVPTERYTTGSKGDNSVKLGELESSAPPVTIDPPAPQPERPTGTIPPDEWASWPDEKLLYLRISQLGVTIEGSVLESRIAELQRELDARGLAFQPHFWLSAEWFSPDGVPGVAIPFYLAHPRLEKLERAQMLEVEGATKRGA